MTRREFIGTGSAAVAAGIMGNVQAAQPLAKGENFYRGALLHLGSNMWDDFKDDPDGWARSDAELAVRPNPNGPAGKPSQYRSYVRAHDDLWKLSVDHLAKRGMNMVFIDLGEAVVYPSHPELAVAGSWSVEKLRAELARIRALGITPFPKLNFSAGHDAWLKEYHRVLSTPKYYQVVADLIRDTAEIFDHPALFHIGYDEEIAEAQKNSFYAVLRQGDLWWHDFNYTVGQVEKNGSRAVMWSDAMCNSKDEFFKRITKSVLLSPWYYGKNFTKAGVTWDYKWEKCVGTFKTQHNLAAMLPELNERGFEMLPCTSNWHVTDGEVASAAMVKYIRENLDSRLVKGVYTAPWKMTIPDTQAKQHISATLRGIDLLASALDS